MPQTLSDSGKMLNFGSVGVQNSGQRTNVLKSKVGLLSSTNLRIIFLALILVIINTKRTISVNNTWKCVLSTLVVCLLDDDVIPRISF